MKIAFIVPEFPSLSQTFVLNQITGLLDRGHDVEIFAGSASSAHKLHPDVTRYGLLERTTYFPMIPAGRLKRMLKGMQYAFSHFPRDPQNVLQSLNIIKFGKLAASFILLFRVIPFLGKGPYSVIHCHFGPLGNIAVQCRRAGVLKGRLVTTFHGYDLTSFLKKNSRHVYDELFEYCDLCLPISNHWGNKLREMGCRPEKIKVHRMGVDVLHFKNLRKDIERNSGKTKILSVARLTEKKGVEYGIKAVSKVIERFPNVEYAIAGDGPLRTQLEQLIKRLNLENHVYLLGWMNQEEITQLMSQADIMIAPSITASDGDQEGIPVVLMEALAMKLPVISTYHSGIPELIIDGRTGLLVKERDTSVLAEKITALIQDPDLARHLSTEGRRYIQQNFNISTLNDKLIDIYHKLIDSNAA